ncbi:four-carbon acid sugar kinase family protein [Saccharopolyspora sp. ID03-671]|uniref:3-oxo-tetronate kinase n=1 Tax=Saccharopolyspora sp. ID03-671 TaxID=3073066 RepID=UPI003243380C
MSGGVLGVIADDYTGGTDVAAALRRGGLRVVLHFGLPDERWAAPECDALVIALKTRTTEPDRAVEQSLRAQRLLAERGASRLYFKYCSTFDSTDEGNIGVVADALADATGEALTIVCPASPEHGRTVYQGHLFVGDRLLSESSMRHHPLTPMTDPDLVRVLGRQTARPVANLPLAVVRGGAEAVRLELDRLRANGIRHVVADAVIDEDLTALARACPDRRLLTGGAGLAGALGGGTGAHAEGADLPGGPGIVLAGSCSTTTLTQVAGAREEMPSLRLRLGNEDEAMTWLADHARQTVMIYASAPPEERGGPGEAEAFEHALAALGRRAVELGYRRLVVAGGETSGAVVKALGVESVEVTAEADRGVPWCVSTGEPRIALLLKSGNFGGRDLLSRAARGGLR